MGSLVTQPLLTDDGTGRIQAELARLSSWTPKDAGPIRATFSPNPPWWLTLPWLLTAAVLTVLAYPVNPDFFPAAAAIIWTIFGGVALAAWLWARSHKTRVAQHGLVLGGPSKTVIPYATIDPGRSAVSTRVRYLGRHVHSGGTRILQSQGRVAVINGLNPNPAAISPHNPPSTVPSPFCEWGLSGDPAQVLSAVEAAMIEAGYPAHGMADQAMRRTFRPTKDHPTQDLLLARRAVDPPIGVGPAGR